MEEEEWAREKFQAQFFLKVYFWSLKGLTAEYPATLKQPTKVGGYVDARILSHYVSAYPLCQYLFNNSDCISAYPLRYTLKTAYKGYSMSIKGRKVHKRDNCVSMYPALSGIQL